ncbi:MAG: hypothetical protein J0L88_03465 [Xanthomonadales bacterium]|nr:hypothetical protein [Xanthomonadales bacterium]
MTRSFGTLGLLTMLLQSGCASVRLAHDPLCQELAAFANSVKAGESRSITLETAWGSSKRHPDSLYSKDCLHGDYEPGSRLCAYLIDHSATEFAHNNFRRAFACLSRTPAHAKNYISYERLDVRVSAVGAISVDSDVDVSMEFKWNEDNRTYQLDIAAQRFESPDR